MPFRIFPTLLNAMGQEVWRDDAFHARNLSYSYKLNGGDALASFDLPGGLVRDVHWLVNFPAAKYLVIKDGGGQPLWFGEFWRAGTTPNAKMLTVQYAGMWHRTNAMLATNQWANGGGVGTQATLKTVTKWLYDNGLMPGLLWDNSLFGEPGVQFNDPTGPHASNARDGLQVDHRYPRQVIQDLIQQGDSANQWHMAVYWDRYLRAFKRDLTLRWQCYANQIEGDVTMAFSKAGLFTKLWGSWDQIFAETNATGTTTAGSNALTTGTAFFRPEHVGQVVVVTGAGAPAGAPVPTDPPVPVDLIATITGYVDPASVTLSGNAGTTIAGTAIINIARQQATPSWVVASNPDVQTALGYQREAVADNPYRTQQMATNIVTMNARDHNRPSEEGQGFSLKSKVLTAGNQLVPAYWMRPGQVIRIVDFASSYLDLSTTAADQRGNYYIVEMNVDVDGERVSVTPDSPNPHLQSVQISQALS